MDRIRSNEPRIEVNFFFNLIKYNRYINELKYDNWSLVITKQNRKNKRDPYFKNKYK